MRLDVKTFPLGIRRDLSSSTHVITASIYLNYSVSSLNKNTAARI